MNPLLNTLLIALLLALTSCSNNQPAAYPHKTVTIVCPWAPGGGTDRVSRYWADALQKELGQPFVVVNRTGGSGVVGHSACADARPDGYTLGMITAELSTMHHLGICQLTYKDYQCLMQVNADAAAILVGKDAPWKDLPSFLKHVRQNPGKIKMSGTAAGGLWDLARLGLQDAAEIPQQSVVWVPTQGAAPSLQELLGGHIDAVCCSLPEAAAQIESGQIRALAVMSEERSTDFPDVPTVKEAGVDWVAMGWRGLAMPKDTPTEIVDKVHQACEAVAASPEYLEFMKKNGFGVKIRPRDEFAKFLAEQDQTWGKVLAK